MAPKQPAKDAPRRTPSEARAEPDFSLKVTQCSTATAFSETQNKIRTELLMHEEFPINQLLQEAFFSHKKSDIYESCAGGGHLAITKPKSSWPILAFDALLQPGTGCSTHDLTLPRGQWALPPLYT